MSSLPARRLAPPEQVHWRRVSEPADDLDAGGTWARFRPSLQLPSLVQLLEAWLEPVGGTWGDSYESITVGPRAGLMARLEVTLPTGLTATRCALVEQVLEQNLATMQARALERCCLVGFGLAPNVTALQITPARVVRVGSSCTLTTAEQTRLADLAGEQWQLHAALGFDTAAAARSPKAAPSLEELRARAERLPGWRGGAAIVGSPADRWGDEVMARRLPFPWSADARIELDQLLDQLERSVTLDDQLPSC